MLSCDFRPSGLSWMTGLAGAVLILGAATAQTTPRAEREPNPAAATAAERAAGVAPGAAEIRREDRVTDQIFRELTGRNPVTDTGVTAPPPSGSVAQDATETNRLYRDLTDRNPNAAGAVAPPAPSASVAQDATETDRLYRELTGQSPNAAPPRN